MTQALINPTQQVQYISSWILNPQWYIQAPPSIPKYIPVYSIYANSETVCQIEPDDLIFPVANPFYWLSCPDNIVAYDYYYESNTQQYIQIVNASYPSEVATEPQPISIGTQSA
jgi:hypothetical protein